MIHEENDGSISASWLHLYLHVSFTIILLVLSREWMGMGEWDDY